MIDLTKFPEKIRLEIQLEDLLVFAEKLLESKSVEKTTGSESEILTVDEAADFLRLAKQTVYQLTSQRGIPFYKKNKRIYFKRTELAGWLQQGRQKTQKEFDAELMSHIRKVRKSNEL